MEKMLEMLEIVAVKMGTTVEYLWPLYVKRVAMLGIAHSVLCVAVIVIGCVIIKRSYRSMGEKIKNNDLYDGHLALVILFSVIVFFASISLPTEIVDIFVPEPEALRQILNIAK